MKQIVMFLYFLIICCSFLNVLPFKIRKIPLQSVDLETVSDNFGIKLWQHVGFSHMSGLQINEQLNLQVKVTPKLLASSGESPAHLQTTLKNYEHTFLTIKFSSIIGKLIDETAKEIEPPTLKTTSVVPDKELLQPLLTSEEKVQEENQTDTNSNSPKIDQNLQSTPEDEKVSKPLVHKASLKNLESEQLTKTKTDRIRKKRDIEFSKQDLLQIYKIIEKVKKSAENNSKSNTADGNSSATTTTAKVKAGIFERVGAAPLQPTTKMKDSTQDLNNSSVDSKLTYKTWRASFDKNYRPPGFYFLVDDQVIFDNWFGMWSRPNVLGRVTPYTSKMTWNETEIQFQWEEPPKRDIKISFEWDPMEKGSFILIDNIEIFTFGVESETPIPNSIEKNVPSNNGNSNNNNLTVYIVVKPDSHHHDHDESVVMTAAAGKVDVSGSKKHQTEIKNVDLSVEQSTESLKEKNLADDLLELIKTVQNNRTKEQSILNGSGIKNTTITTTTQKPETTTAHKTDDNKTTKSLKSDKTGLIVLITLIIIGSFILIAILHRKFKEDRNPNKMGRHC